MLGKEASTTVLYPVLDVVISEACYSDDAATPMPANLIDSEQLSWLDIETEEEKRMGRSRSSDSISSESFLISSSSSAAFWTYYSSQTSSTFHTARTIVSSHSYRSITIDCEWDSKNRLQVIRFLTLRRLLTVGKTAKVFPGFPNAVIRARTDPEFVYEQTGNELQTYYSSLGQEVKWNILVSADDRAEKTFSVREEESVQLCVVAHTSIMPIRAEWHSHSHACSSLLLKRCKSLYSSILALYNMILTSVLSTHRLP